MGQVRAKFTCVEKIDNGEGETDLRFSAIADAEGENAEYWHYTPNGDITMSCLNERAAEQFEEGEDYYVDFTPA